MKNLFPFIFDLSNKRLLFVGGGNVAERKILQLSTFAKEIVVIAPDITEKLLEMSKKDGIIYKRKLFEESDIDCSFDLVFACTNNVVVNKSVIDICKKLKIFVSAVDSENKEMSDFFMPASIIKDDYLIAISSFGKACAQAKKLKNIVKDVLANNKI